MSETQLHIRDDLKDLTSFEGINSDLAEIFKFMLEAKKLKGVTRQCYNLQEQRFENSAEHSWHVLLFAIVMEKYANEDIDMLKVLKMIALHDLGEIDDGDTFFYDKDVEATLKKEEACLDRLFAGFDEGLRGELKALWLEFEEGESAEAKYAQALDRFQPFLYMLKNSGESWRRYKLTRPKVLKTNAMMESGSNPLWDAYQILTKQAEDAGYFYED